MSTRQTPSTEGDPQPCAQGVVESNQTELQGMTGPSADEHRANLMEYAVDSASDFSKGALLSVRDGETVSVKYKYRVSANETASGDIGVSP